MVNKNTIIAIILIMVAVTLIGLGVVIAIKEFQAQANAGNDSIERIYLVQANGAFGVMSASGKTIAKPQYTKIARINDMLYLKSTNASYLYNLTTGKSVTLDGVETDILYIQGNDGLLDKYILQYGETDSDAIYRIIDASGEKVSTKDFASVDAVYNFLELTPISNFIPKDVLSTSLNKTDVVATLSYPTTDGKSQYIVKSGDKFGIVDENNTPVVETTFDKIDQIKNSSKACTAIKGDSNYLILDNGNSIATESGFEFDYNGTGYVIQKRGATGNKIYNLNGEVVVDKIFSYPTKLVTLNGTNANYLLLQDDKSGLWSIYNIDTTEKLQAEYSNLVVDYLYV